MEPALAVGGVILLIGGIAWLAWHLEKKRTEAMQQYAQSHGFVFEGAGSQLVAQCGSFKLFNQGHSKRLKNALRGAKDRAALSIADYQYVTGSGKHRTTHVQTICVVRVPGMALPHFFIRRQYALFDALGKMFGGQDINFVEDKAFSDAFVLQTHGSEQELRRYFNDRARAHFVSHPNKSVQVEGVGETLLVHYGRRLALKDIDGLVADAINISRLWSPPA